MIGRITGASLRVATAAAGLAAILSGVAGAQTPPPPSPAAAPAPAAPPPRVIPPAGTLFSINPALNAQPRPFQVFSLDPAFDALVAPGTQLETVALLPVFNSEGAMWRKGEIWVNDQVGGSYAVSPKGTWRTVLPKDAWPIEPRNRWMQGANGQAPWKDGAVLLAREGPRDIGILSKDGKLSSFFGAWEGKTLNSPNDLTVAPDGAVWFTDPPFSVPGYYTPRFDGGPVDKPIPFNAVFRLKDGKATPMITDMDTQRHRLFARRQDPLRFRLGRQASGGRPKSPASRL